jgi:hypothetical protein
MSCILKNILLQWNRIYAAINSTYSVLRNKDQTDLIESINQNTNGLPKFAYKQLIQQISTENAVTIIEFIKCQKTEINPSDSYKSLVIRSLIILIKYFKSKKFKHIQESILLIILIVYESLKKLIQHINGLELTILEDNYF